MDGYSTTYLVEHAFGFIAFVGICYGVYRAIKSGKLDKPNL